VSGEERWLRRWAESLVHQHDKYGNAISGRALIRGGGSRGGAREGGDSEERVNNTNASGTYSYGPGAQRGCDLEGVGGVGWIVKGGGSWV